MIRFLLILRFYDSMSYQLLFDRHFQSPQKVKNRGVGTDHTHLQTLALYLIHQTSLKSH